ncbi:MAG: hypothetical protein RQ731_03935 [Anaerosomatales bacterium]|nr:hypothetical protein [Anaerosomatales bacterium]MDT8433894.1 hypothetical protein [Anaerosomatales bacterium]
MASSAETTVRTASGIQMQHGDHIDTIESVDAVFRAQRKLSFAYGAVFFVVTLAIPAMSVWWESWYVTPVWGGFTVNYLVVSLLYYLFLWGLSYTYIKKADKLDENLSHMADEIAAKTAVAPVGGGENG